MAYHTRPGKGSGPVFLRPSPEPSGSSSNSVCPVCKNWSLERWTTPSHGRRESPGAPMRVDFFQVAESAYEEQCRFCYVIYYSLLAMGCDVQISGYSVLSLHAKPKAPFYVLWDDARVGRSVVEVFREKDSKCLLNMLGSATPLREDLRDPRLYDEIRQLRNECEKKHPACSQVTGELPRRLLHIGSAARPDVRVTASFPEDARYIALSHCWGPDAPFTTTWVTLTQREEGIEWNDLPRTFQDAITVARQLDVEYMWIDSLCIIQDDEDDWAVESLKMGFIYERAYLTVAAATAASDREGFLDGSPGREHFAARTIDMDPFGGPSGVQARRVFDVRATTLRDPLHTRAWTPGDTYLAGMWRLDLAGGLTWAADLNKHGSLTQSSIRKGPRDEEEEEEEEEEGSRCRTTRVYRAPSWSWASIDGPTCLDGLGDVVGKSAESDWKFRVLDAHTDVSSANPYGEVTGGWLRIRGRLATAVLTIYSNSWVDPKDGRPRPPSRPAMGLKLLNFFGDVVPAPSHRGIGIDTPLEPRLVLNGSVTTGARVAGGGDWLERKADRDLTVRIMMVARLLNGGGPFCLILGNNGLYGDDATCFERLGVVNLHDDSLDSREDVWQEEEFMII
ncbi:HET domain-containing protein [Verticillium dahliae]|nr:HET domain-containing protein [Verticillium dahliae]